MISSNHPRANSLNQRRLLEQGLKEGITTRAGLIAFGRGEAFDYLLGEKTTKFAQSAIKAAAALLLLCKKPVVSVNGNTSLLVPKEIAQLSKALKARVEVNIFYPPKNRRKKIAKKLAEFGIKVLGAGSLKKIEGFSSNRSFVDESGIWVADSVLVALEDGDRTQALKRVGKKVVAIDLNPLSRTAQKADITIVDNVVRAIPKITKEIKKLKRTTPSQLKKILNQFNNKNNLKNSLKIIRGKI